MFPNYIEIVKNAIIQRFIITRSGYWFSILSLLIIILQMLISTKKCSFDKKIKTTFNN